MTIKFADVDFTVLDKILKRCERFSDARVRDLGCEGIDTDPNYLRACELMTIAEREDINYSVYFEIFELVNKVDLRWGW